MLALNYACSAKAFRGVSMVQNSHTRNAVENGSPAAARAFRRHISICASLNQLGPIKCIEFVRDGIRAIWRFSKGTQPGTFALDIRKDADTFSSGAISCSLGLEVKRIKLIPRRGLKSNINYLIMKSLSSTVLLSSISSVSQSIKP